MVGVVVYVSDTSNEFLGAARSLLNKGVFSRVFLLHVAENCLSSNILNEFATDLMEIREKCHLATYDAFNKATCFKIKIASFLASKNGSYFLIFVKIQMTHFSP